MKILLGILLLAILSTTALANNDKIDSTTEQNIKYQKEILIQDYYRLKYENDSLKLNILNSKIEDEYLKFLENTNQQLTNKWTPINTMFIIIGVLITILTLLGAIAFYFVGKEFKDRQNETLTRFENKFEELRNRKEKEFNSHISEWAESVKRQSDQLQDSSNKYVDLVHSLNNSRIRQYYHSGWKHFDINENIEVDKKTIFQSLVNLNSIGQRFVIYFRVLADDNKEYWMGFSGDKKDSIFESRSEHTQNKKYDTQQLHIRLNVYEHFKHVYKEKEPLRINKIRLRGSDNDLGTIEFKYNFPEPENNE